MELIINDKDITASDQSIRSCKYKDFAGAHVDALQVIFNDTYDEWRSWKLKKNDTIRIKKGMIDTGTMYVSGIKFENGLYGVDALSTPAKSLDESSSIRENILLLEICNEVSKELGFQLTTYDIKNHPYAYVERINENAIAYLSSILLKEGYLVKVFNKSLIVFDERVHERSTPQITVESSDFIAVPSFSTNDAKLIACVENIYQHESGTIHTKALSGLPGKRLIFNIPVTSQGESERFCKNIMRNRNKYEYVGCGYVDDLGITAGVTINLDGDYADWSGTNFVYEVIHDLVHGNNLIKFRKPISGDY